MRTKTVTIHTFEELSDDAQQTAIDNWREQAIDFAWNAEWRDSLNAFCDVTGIDAYDWQVGYGGSYVNWRFDGLEGIEPDDLTGLRLRTWLINNWLPKFRTGKWYSQSWDSKNRILDCSKGGKSRYSRIQFEYDNCPLTGYCGDMSLIQPVLNFIAKPDSRTSLADIIEDCLSGWARDWEVDMEYQRSDEYIRDAIESNEYEFYADGSMV
jgi:hypothetical protein